MRRGHVLIRNIWGGIYVQGLIGILCGIIIVLVIILLKYFQQIRDICRQLSFLQEHDSNMRITSEIDLGGIGALTKQLNALLLQQREERIQYRRKEQMISETYTNLSHDIRTPLTSLDGYFQLLSDSDSKEEQERYVRIIRERVDSLKEMLEELFLFTRLKNTAYPLPLSPCDLNRIVKDTVFSYYEEWKKRSIEPDIVLSEQSCVIMGNRQALHRTLQNIIKNGLVHGENAIRIRLTVERAKQEKAETERDRKGKDQINSEPGSGQAVVLSISNPVRSVEQIDVSRVFERFYRSDSERSSGSTGLGLAIAREFVLRMNGTIEAFLDGDEFGVRIWFWLV